MKKMMQCVLAATALALTVGMTAASAQQDNSSSGSSSGMSSDRSMSSGTGMTSGSETMGGMASHTDWSRRYVLTPMEYRRLSALGLSDQEVFAAANVAERSGIQLDGPNLDDPVQMMQRGAAMWDIAHRFNVPLTTLEQRRPEWDSAEWRKGDTGFWYAHSSGMTGTTDGRDQYRSTTTRSRRTRTRRDRTTTDTTPTPSTGPGTNQNNQPGTGNSQ